jgi:hypothetical protein
VKESALNFKFLATPLFIGSLLLSASSWAYVPPSFFIVKSVAAKHGGIKGVKIRSMVTVMDGEKPGTIRFKAIAHYNPNTGTLHAYAYDERGQKLYAVERRDDSATGADALLFWRDENKVAAALKARGIPIRTEDELLKMKDEDERRLSEVTRLARWNSANAWVIGGPEKDTPQLWVEKDSFLPLRLIAAPRPESSSSDIVDLQFEGQRYQREFPYPRVVVAVQGKRPLFRDEVQDITITLDPAEFRSGVTPGFTETGNSSPGSLRDLIQKYFEVLR